ncbi:hypothetical protein HER32_06565 [Hymenobacter sp. BT18]|uniref:hypothetical protein n=1 Tax=Hymenobacter sp. BT18 TaxID=2835648 RepID=UPI00143EA8B9|nr:hypothetical protein [Hymenobacter sp. BT18]QIX60855.1 hypothetical protein HER32_06565 [Hymenobacter sp. BT18]
MDGKIQKVGVEMQESALYEFTCSSGHESKIYITNPKYDILFEAGLQAISEGYYREAVFNFSASLERFYEYYMVALMLYSGNNYKDEDFQEIWKRLEKQSERQLGAFWMLYYGIFGKLPLFFDNKYLKEHGLRLYVKDNDPIYFRNIVTHQGHFPTYNQAVAYGEAINRYMYYLKTLHKKPLRQNSFTFYQSLSTAQHIMFFRIPRVAYVPGAPSRWSFPTFINDIWATHEGDYSEEYFVYKNLIDKFPLQS